MSKSNLCSKCNSSKFVKHGLTTFGSQRYRCLNCGKTWVNSKSMPPKVDLADISYLYLQGKTTGELVEYYPTTPAKINKQVRSFLDNCPDWHNYVDSASIQHKPQQIYLSGKTFHCSWKTDSKNHMFVAFAIDTMTNFVIAYKVACDDSSDVWVDLFNNLKLRNVSTNSFLTNGSESSLQALELIYPNTDKRIMYHKTYRDKELNCCLSRMSPSEKLLNDASRIYFLNDNVKLANFLGIPNDVALLNFLVKNKEKFTGIVYNRLQLRSKLLNDNLPNMFQKRFEKFHLLKEDPMPIINSWIASRMLTPDTNGMTKFALYMQQPYMMQFKHFVKNKIMPVMYENSQKPFLESLLLEVVARGLELPIYNSDCNYNTNKCLLVG